MDETNFYTKNGWKMPRVRDLVFEAVEENKGEMVDLSEQTKNMVAGLLNAICAKL